MIRCDRCGEDEDLYPENSADGVRIRCEHCGHVWPRDERAPCETCGSTDLVSRPLPLTQYSRGTQLSIVGWVNVDCCTLCDAEALEKSVRAGGPLPAGYMPAARRAREPKPSDPTTTEEH